MDSLNPEQYALIVGAATDNPLTSAFSRKRVVHAGVRGKGLKLHEWQQTWQSLLKEKVAIKPRAAYIHIPFCSHRCLYCGFFQNYSNETAESVYVNSLIKELRMSQGSRYLASGPINAVFLGGGTPSALSPHDIARLLRAIRECLPLANDCELTLEGRINDVTPAKIEAWLANGVNRVSLGVQSFNTTVRRAVGRLDDTETVLSRLQLLSSYNQAAVIIDLIYGLPYQTPEIWADDLRQLKTAAIDGLDIYQLNLFEDGALQQAINAGKLPAAATTAEQANMFATAEAELSAGVFSRLSRCHWGKTRRERSLYNTLTKAGYNIIPFGAGAGGNISGVSMFLNRNVAEYIKAIEQEQKPLLGMSLQPPGSDLRNRVTAQLEECYLDIHALAADYGSSVLELTTLLDIWEARDLIRSGPSVARLTVAGQFWAVNITQSILECLNAVLNGEQSLEVQPIAAQG